MGSLKVMKGVSYTEKRLIQWLKEDGYVYVQPKRDEIRCVVTIHEDLDGAWVEYTSAQGKPLYNLSQFDGMWLALAKQQGVTVFDTGISVNENFDITRRVVRSSTVAYDLTGGTIIHLWDKKPTKKNPAGVMFYGGTLNAKFWLYDLPECSKAFEDRHTTMVWMASGLPHIGVPETYLRRTVDSVESKYGHCIDAGLEGVMIKRADFQYKYGRSTDWMKMKPEEEKDGIITGFTEGQGKFNGLIGSATIDFGDGSSTSVSGMDDATRLDMSRNPDKYIGRVARIPYMQRDSQGGYRHPRWGGLHEDKSREDVLSAPNC